MTSTIYLIMVLVIVIIVSVFLRAQVDRFLTRQLRLLDRQMDRLRQTQEERQRSSLRAMRAAEDKDQLERDVVDAEKLRDRKVQAVDVLRRVQMTFVHVFPRLANRPGDFYVLMGRPPEGSEAARMAGPDQQLLLLVAGLSRQDIEDVLRSYPPLRGFQIKDSFEMKRFRRFASSRVDARIAALDTDHVVGGSTTGDAQAVALLPAPNSNPRN
jgi:hypothetical protein